MGDSLVQINVHLIFSTKHRRPFLQPPSLRESLHGHLGYLCGRLQSPSLIVGGVEDHVHILCRLGKTISVSRLVQELKRDSSQWVKDQDRRLWNFYWQTGYGAFSVSPPHAESLVEYIKNQEEHHRRESFQDEFRRICREYGIAIDERYVWD